MRMREALFVGALGIVVLGLVPGAALPARWASESPRPVAPTRMSGISRVEWSRGGNRASPGQGGAEVGVRSG